jgi:hypothetical protein
VTIAIAQSVSIRKERLRRRRCATCRPCIGQSSGEIEIHGALVVPEQDIGDAAPFGTGLGDKKYEVEAYVRNVENNTIKTNAYVYMVQNSASTLVPYPLAIYQPPRTCGVTFRYRF